MKSESGCVKEWKRHNDLGILCLDLLLVLCRRCLNHNMICRLLQILFPVLFHVSEVQTCWHWTSYYLYLPICTAYVNHFVASVCPLHLGYHNHLVKVYNRGDFLKHVLFFNEIDEYNILREEPSRFKKKKIRIRIIDKVHYPLFGARETRLFVWVIKNYKIRNGGKASTRCRRDSLYRALRSRRRRQRAARIEARIMQSVVRQINK